jgi:hypothetical protein
MEQREREIEVYMVHILKMVLKELEEQRVKKNKKLLLFNWRAY